MAERPSLFLLAGPDGAGKTTYAFKNIRAVSGSARFVNLDEIARGLSPLDPPAAANRAARVALDFAHACIAERASFSIETTLAGRTHLRTVAAARAAGFAINLFYFAASSPDVCLTRIARRVAEGGHDVPAADVRRRFCRSLANLPAYAALCDVWRVFDVTRLPVRVAAEGRFRCLDARNGDGLPATLTQWLNRLPSCGPPEE